jgi:uridylate kinase
MEKGRVVIFAAGAGMPYFSTDTVSVQRALETRCSEVIFGKNGVDAVYSADPRTDPAAVRIEHITFRDALQQRLEVLDASAFSLCMENNLPMVVFGLEKHGNVTRALLGERIGTLVTA